MSSLCIRSSYAGLNSACYPTATVEQLEMKPIARRPPRLVFERSLPALVIRPARTSFATAAAERVQAVVFAYESGLVEPGEV